MTNNEGTFYGGTSGLQVPMPKRDFPPEHAGSSRLTYYAHLFNSIEVNSSFYKVPQAATISKWAREVLPGFKFTFKLWRDITHNKGLAFNTTDIERFMKVIEQAGDKKGSLLVQFPPSLQVVARPQLENLLAVISENNAAGWDIAVEFRHRSWYQEGVYEVLDRYNAAFVIHDMPASAAPLEAIHPAFAYLRFHGPEGRYRGSYDDAFLYEYAGYVKEWQQEGKTVYVYFNNTMGEALKNLMALYDFISNG